MRRADDPYTVIDRCVFAALAIAAATIMALDLVTGARLLVFASNPPVVHQVEAHVRHQGLGRKAGAVLRVGTPDGGIALSTGPSTVLGTQRSGVDSKRVHPDVPTTVAWIDAPARVGAWTTHYPIRVEQMGRVLLDIDGAAGIVRAELPGVIIEAVLAGAVAAGLLWMPIARHRRDRRKMATARDAWHQRHAR